MTRYRTSHVMVMGRRVMVRHEIHPTWAWILDRVERWRR